MKQRFVSLGPLCCLHRKDVITGISTEPFSGIVHLAGSMVSRTGERVLALRTVLSFTTGNEFCACNSPSSQVHIA